MSTAPIPPVVRSPQLVRDVTDASQNRSKQFIPSAYAVGKLFTGVTLPDNIDLNTYVTPGVSRLNTYRNGPPVTSPGYLVIHSVNPDEDQSGVGYRYRQIYYPDSTTETTPYTRVGTGTSSDAITWSTWTTMGGNWVCEILNANKTGIVNYMYHSFGTWALTLPDPKDYVQGTRIGLTQWLNQGSVVYGPNTQPTTPDIDKNSNVIGALQYIFQIVPDNTGVNQWSLDVDQDLSDWLDDMRSGLQDSIDTLTAKHESDVEKINTLIENTKTSLQASIDKEISDRTAADTALSNTLNNRITSEVNSLNYKLTILDRDKQRAMKTLRNMASGTFVYDVNSTDLLIYNLAHYDYRVMVFGNGTFTLPTNVDMHGATVIFLIQKNVTCTIVAGSTSETFSNQGDSVLVIDMQTVATSVANQYVWTVLEVG